MTGIALINVRGWEVDGTVRDLLILVYGSLTFFSFQRAFLTYVIIDFSSGASAELSG